MKNLTSGNNQILSKFTNIINYQICGLGVILCLFTCFSLEVSGQSNQKSKPTTDTITQSKPVKSNQSSENQRTNNQNKIGKITVKEDEFSNKKTTTLTEHSLSPMLTITMKCIVDKKANRTPMERYLDFATVEFTSNSGKREYGFGSEVNFLVDGKSVKGNQVNSLISRRQNGVEIVVTALGFDVLIKISQGREVKMKLGENVFLLDNEFKKLIKEFVNSAQ